MRPAEPRPTIHPFDGYPYLVTRIGRSALRHLAVLPADLGRASLISIAARQAAVNRFDTAVVLGPGDAVFATPDGAIEPATFVPTGMPVCDALVVVATADLGSTAELAARRERLRRYVADHRGGGYVVGDGLEAGALATHADLERLLGTGQDGLPRALERCTACGVPRGEALRPLPRDGRAHDPAVGREVVRVPCRCENPNRCAGCGQPLAERALSAWSWDEERRSLMYWAAYIGLSHRCARTPPCRAARPSEVPPPVA